MEKELVKNINKIYNLLQDDLSKKIFAGRLLYSLTDDVKYLREVICTTAEGMEFLTRMRTENKKKILFGAGSIGKQYINIFHDIKFECYADNNHAGELCNGLPVINIKTLKEKYYDDLIIIASRVFHYEISEQLLSEGFKEENIINVGKYCDTLSHVQYFDLPELQLNINEKEVFVDGGCYDGKNTYEFQNWCNRSNVKDMFVYAWEPDPENLKQCKAILDNNQNKYKLINKGLWSKAATLFFEMAETASTITENGTMKIKVDSIDNALDSPVTFIKMDVEGAESKALLGAERTIKKYSPKLAICVYHKPEDIWEIPLLIHKMNPSYRFYLRHYSLTNSETVLYAIDTNN